MTMIGSFIKLIIRVVAASTLSIIVNLSSASAEDFTAGVVMTKMTAGDRYAFMAGVAEGLAHNRMVKDGGAVDGARCIYQWFYDRKETLPEIYQAFDYFKDEMPGAVMAAMVEKECGA
jgi:hypothetical protein